jgi:hypothetical protein
VWVDELISARGPDAEVVVSVLIDDDGREAFPGRSTVEFAGSVIPVEAWVAYLPTPGGCILWLIGDDGARAEAARWRVEEQAGRELRVVTTLGQLVL